MITLFSLLTNRAEWIIFSINQKGCDEEEYTLPLKRESGCRSGAERPLEGRRVEGSFRAGELNAVSGFRVLMRK